MPVTNGVTAKVDGVQAAAGNGKLMKRLGLACGESSDVGTVVHVAPPIPPKKLKGMEITSAQGQLIRRKVSARNIHVRGVCQG